MDSSTGRRAKGLEKDLTKWIWIGTTPGDPSIRTTTIITRTITTIGYVAMMLEREETEANEIKSQGNSKQKQPVTAGVFDTIKNTKRTEPTIICSRLDAFIDDNENVHEVDGDTTTNEACTTNKQNTTHKHKSYQRQRRRFKEQSNALLDNTTVQQQFNALPNHTTTQPQHNASLDDTTTRPQSQVPPWRRRAALRTPDLHDRAEERCNTSANRNSTEYIKCLRNKAHMRQAHYE